MGCYRTWKRRRPELPVVYWSDTGATAYGKLPADALRRRVEGVCRELASRGVRRVAIACHSASTVAGDLDVELPVDGMVEHGIRAAHEAVAGVDDATVGVLGGRRTIESGLYQQNLEGPGCSVEARIAQPISGLVERGTLSGPELESTLDEILDGLEGVDAVLLACTHYPAVRDAIQERLPGVRLVDPVDALVERLDAQWRASGGAPDRPDRFFTTGDPEEMAGSAEAAYGVCVEGVQRVELET